MKSCHAVAGDAKRHVENVDKWADGADDAEKDHYVVDVLDALVEANGGEEDEIGAKSVVARCHRANEHERDEKYDNAERVQNDWGNKNVCVPVFDFWKREWVRFR